MQLVDTHCHIQSAGNASGERTTGEIWAKDPMLTGKMLVSAAVQDGITKMICVGCDLTDSRLAVEFVQQHSETWASIGVHPHEAQHYARDSELQNAFADLVTAPKVIAVGECGLDYFYTHSPQADQAAVLRFQIELATTHNLPLIFHVREAFDDFWPIFDEYTGIRGVLHSFTDNQANLDKAIERNLYIGVNGIATFAKNVSQLEVYRSIPLSKLLLETDAPFLTPTPYRGTINQPKRVETIAKYLAKLRGENLDQVARVSTSNAHELFGI